jgi:TctA family transporter
MFELMQAGLQTILVPHLLALIVRGVIVGIVFGVFPG